MTRVNHVKPSPDSPTVDEAARSSFEEAIARHEARNFVVLAGHQILVRIGWIFKTESVIVPAFMDTIGGAGWQRGLLPVLNRFAQSVPPALWAGQLERQSHKRRSLVGWTVVMGGLFLLLSVQWFGAGRQPRPWMAWSFLLLYGLFGAVYGISLLAFNALQGKLIHPARRGRLMAVSTATGVVPAVLCAWWLMPPWLALPDGGFGYIFLFTGGCFTLAALWSLGLREPADAEGEPAVGWGEQLAASWHVMRYDAAFRPLAVVTALSSMSLMLFPHYQALAREQLGLAGTNLMWWVIVQNLGTGAASALAGPLADRHGTRLALRWLILANACVPLLACGLVWVDPERGRGLFWLVFVLMGLVPVTTKTLTNYTLEIAPERRQALYVSTMNLLVAAPFVFSPVIGWLVDLTNFETVLLLGGGLIAAAGLATYRLAEPRGAIGS